MRRPTLRAGEIVHEPDRGRWWVVFSSTGGINSKQVCGPPVEEFKGNDMTYWDRTVAEQQVAIVNPEIEWPDEVCVEVARIALTGGA